jgi:hypothetical protein
MTDKEIIDFVKDSGFEMGDLFLVGDRVYVSKDAGDFQATSTYQPMQETADDRERLLALFLQRTGAPAYDSTAQIDD